MNKQKKISKIIYLGLTGQTEADWKSKLAEINHYKIKSIGLFLECYSRNQRDKIYKALEESVVEKIPLIHIRNDMKREELKYLHKKYNSPYFTIHEGSFKFINEWKGYFENLYLEMNKDNRISTNVNIDKIGGFCVDLSHFKSAEEKWSKEFEYTLKKRNKKIIFACNHLNGYSCEKNTDLHVISSLKEFDYLKTLPKFIFGNVIALEVDNSIKEQIEFKKYLINLLG